MTPPTRTPIASVVVPAHDEGEHIAATLTALLEESSPHEFEVVVVCNGCRDDTAEIARRFSHVRVEELRESSKIAALRHGDQVAVTFPRIYLDGDIELSTDAARAIVGALDTPAPRVAGVPGHMDGSGSTWAVRSYFDFRQRLTVFHDGIIGAGVYALNRSGRERFGTWPDVVGDDLYIRLLFDKDERITVRDHHTRVGAPPDLRSVVRRQVRVRRGIADVTRGDESVAAATPPAGIATALREIRMRPSAWPGALVWAAVNALSRILARVNRQAGDWRLHG